MVPARPQNTQGHEDHYNNTHKPKVLDSIPV